MFHVAVIWPYLNTFAYKIVIFVIIYTCGSAMKKI